MKILVTVKRVPDYEAKISLAGDGSGIQTEGLKWIVNPFDEIAVEEALRIKESGRCDEVVVVGIGPSEAVTQLRYGMAMGADRGILVEYDGQVDSDLASRVFVKVYEREQPDLVILGKQAIDSDANQTPQLLAERLGISQACFASQVSFAEDRLLHVTREVDGGLETVAIPLPAVISTDLRLNEPRYAPLPGIMKAKKKPLDVLSLDQLEVSADVKVRVRKMSLPEERQAGRKVESVEELVDALANEARVI